MNHYGSVICGLSHMFPLLKNGVIDKMNELSALTFYKSINKIILFYYSNTARQHVAFFL